MGEANWDSACSTEIRVLEVGIKMTLKEIVQTNDELLKQANNLLKENNKELFEKCYQNVVEEILKYRNEKISSYILDLTNRFHDIDMYISLNGPIEIFTVHNEDDLDPLGKVVEQLMHKYINWGRD